MHALLSPRGLTVPRRSRPYRYVFSLLAALVVLVVPSVASAAQTGFTEERAQARWSISFQCPDGSTGTDGRLFMETDNFIDAGTVRDPNPPLRVAFSGQCPDGTYSWGFSKASPTQFDSNNLKSASVSTGPVANVRDNRGVLHTVSVNVSWTGTGKLETTVNAPGSKTMQRSGTATATVLFDGNTLVDGPANFPFPAPFIRVDTEK